MIKKQYIGEITLGSNVPNLLIGINNLWAEIEMEYQPTLIEVHQVIVDGPGKYLVIYNYYL